MLRDLIGGSGSCIDRMHSNLVCDKVPESPRMFWGSRQVLLACRHWPLGFTDQGYYIPAPHNLACLATGCKYICPDWGATVSGKIPGQKISAKALLCIHRPSDKSSG